MMSNGVLNAKKELWVFVRGWMRSQEHWHGFDQRFKEARQAFLSQTFPNQPVLVETLCIDLLGNGLHQHRSSPLAICRQSEHLYQQILRLSKFDNFYLIGISLGAMVSLDLVLKQSRAARNFCKGLILINPSSRGLGYPWQRLKPSIWPIFLKELFSKGTNTMEESIVKITINDIDKQKKIRVLNQKISDRVKTSKFNAVKQLISAAMYTPKGLSSLATYSDLAPIVVLSSQADALVDARCGEVLAQKLKAKYFCHPSAGHDLTVDDPQWVITQVMASFITF